MKIQIRPSAKRYSRRPSPPWRSLPRRAPLGGTARRRFRMYSISHSTPARPKGRLEVPTLAPWVQLSASATIPLRGGSNRGLVPSFPPALAAGSRRACISRCLPRARQRSNVGDSPRPSVRLKPRWEIRLWPQTGSLSVRQGAQQSSPGDRQERGSRTNNRAIAP